MIQKILNEFSKVEQFNNTKIKDNIESELKKIFSAGGFYGLSAKIHDNKYVLYMLDLKKNSPMNTIVAKYVTEDQEECMYIIMRHIINKYISDEVISNYSIDNCVSYDEEIVEFEDTIEEDILRQMPDWYKDQYDDEFDIYYRFEKFVKTEAYKQWVKDLSN